ncbi:PGF-CTERM sorting domain-containing protein [Salarchaeum sp. III]|uniref:PGF-CTERM sorting domain-containing protein n=1 Tax=Salarchaeum sp. III TaxID=3107927 RepID=UPI002ED86D15
MQKTTGVVFLAALLPLSAAFTGVGGATTPASDTDDRLTHELEEGQTYWSGTIITKQDYAPNASTAELYTSSGEKIRDIALSDGDLSIRTDGLRGEYYVTAPNATRIGFEVVKESIRLEITELQLSEDPLQPIASVNIDTNRGGATLYVTGPGDNFPSRVSGAGERVDADTIRVGFEASFTTSLAGLDADKYSFTATDRELGVTEVNIFRLNETVLPPSLAPGVATVSRGDDYWRPTVLKIPETSPNTIYRVETLDGEVVERQLSTTAGTLYLGTSDWDAGVYRVLSNQSEVTRFSLQVQSLSATSSGDVVTVSSNHETYQLQVRVSNGSHNVTEQVFPNASAPVLERPAGTATKLELQTDAVSPGEYTVFLSSMNSSARTSVNVSVAAEQTTTQTTQTTTATTPTTSTTTTATTTTTAAASTSPPETTTTTRTTGTTPGSSSGGAPGFGVPMALVALVLASVLLSRQRRQ